MGNRIVSDPLRFTGIDLGDREGVVSRARRALEGGDDKSVDDSDSDGGVDSARLSLQDREDALYESAMARIRRAQEKGKTDVKLSKDELAAFERRRQREEEEERKKRREQRIAVPLSQFDLGPRKRSSIREDSPPRRPSPEPIAVQPQPPMGYFPPSASRSLRPPAATGSSSRTSSRVAAERDRIEREHSPFTYSYVHPDHAPSSLRHASDPAAGRPVTHSAPREETASPPSRQEASQGPVNVFQYMTGGANAPYHSGDRRRSGASISDEETDSDEDYVPREETRVSSSGSGPRGRLREEPAAEGRPVHEPGRRSTRNRTPPATSSSSKKSPSVQSPIRRKSVVSGSTSHRSKRKGK